MTRKLNATDRAATLVAGLVLTAGGLALLNWHQQWIGSWSDTLSTSRFADTESTAWWPWAYAAAGIVLALIGLVWLLAHLPRRGERIVRLDAASNEHGAARVDYQSLATAVAADLEAHSPVTHVKGSTRRRRGTLVVELRGYVDPHATAEIIDATTARCTQNVSDAFPDGTTVFRVLLGHDRRRAARGRASTPRVH